MRGVTVLAVAVLFLAALGVRLYRVDSESIWMDEDMQAGRANRNPFDPTMVNRAAQQQQPPLDYIFESISLWNFGLTTTGARIGSVFFGALTAVGLLLIAMLLSKDRLIWVAAGAMALIHPGLVRYSKEGRPVAMAVFFATVHLLMIFKIISYPTIIRQFDRFLGLVIAEVGLLWSIGFQPVVFLMVSAISLLPLLSLRTHRWTVGLVYLSMGVALLIASPILLNTIGHGGFYLKKMSLFSMFGQISSGVPKLSTEAIVERYTTILGPGTLPILLIVITGFIAIVIKRKAWRGTPSYSEAVYLLSFTILFPLLFDALFHALINYRITERYYLVFAPVLLSLFVVMLQFTVDAIRDVRRATKPALVLTTLIVAGIPLFFAHETFSKIYFSQSQAGWREMYQLFKEPGNEGSRAYMMNLVNKDRYRPYFFSRQFYYTEKPQPVGLSSVDTLPKHYKSKKVWKRCPKLFFAVMYGYNKIHADIFENFPFISTRRFGRLSVIAVEPALSMQQSVLEMFRQLSRYFNAHDAKKEHFFRIHETLFHLENIEKNPNGMKSALKRLKSVNRHRRLSPLIEKLSKQSKKE